jgi:hypothetical protein
MLPDKADDNNMSTQFTGILVAGSAIALTKTGAQLQFAPIKRLEVCHDCIGSTLSDAEVKQWFSELC